MHNAPLIVRVAGMPVSAVEQFSTPLCEREIGRQMSLEARLREMQAGLVETLHERVRQAGEGTRRFYLNLKRDCFNGRGVRKYLTHPQWNEIDPATQEATRAMAEMEAELEERRASFGALYAEQTARNREHLIGVLGDQALLNGIALASPSLAHQLSRLRRTPTRSYRKKERKLELGALRYVSRSGLKLSPYATLTPLGLALVRDAAAPELSFLPGEWAARSIVRIKRYILEQFADALLMSRPFKRSLTVVLNSTLEEVGPNKFQFIRPGQWRATPPGVIKYFLDSLVTTKLSGSLIEATREILRRGGCTYEQLLEEVMRRLGGALPAERAAEAVDELIKLGYLNIRLPWFTNDTSWERKIAQHLGALGDLPALADTFRQLNTLEEEYRDTPTPVAGIAQMEALVEQGWDAIRAATGIKNTVNLIKSRKKYVYQDVLLANRHESAAQQELLHVPSHVIRRLVEEIEPLMRLSMLRWHGYDFLNTLGAFLRRHPRWRGRAPLLHLLLEINPIWQEYVKYDLEYRGGGVVHPFNPLALEEVRQLHELRRRTLESFPYCTNFDGEELRIEPGALKTLVREIPPEYVSPHGPCMMVQPTDAGMGRWVLNRLKEGTGRMGSRFVPLMSEGVRDFYSSSLVSRGRYVYAGERAALMDLMCINGDTLNVHRVQTPYVLEMPGNSFDIPPQRRVLLSDLYVEAPPEGGLPRLSSTKLDERLIPVHLGGAAHDFLSSEIRFLCMFGPCEMDLLLFPPPATRTRGAITTEHRIVNGSIILSRQRWVVPLDALPAQVHDAPDEVAFAEINRWRIDNELPERVFLRLNPRTRNSHTYHKPQYVDFSSPLFVRVFLAALANTSEHFVLEEALPSPSAYPRAANGSQWAVEFLLDTIVADRAEV